MDNKNLSAGLESKIRSDALPVIKNLVNANSDLFNELQGLAKKSKDEQIKQLKTFGLFKDQEDKVNLKIALDNLLLGLSKPESNKDKKVVMLKENKFPGQSDSGLNPMPPQSGPGGMPPQMPGGMPPQSGPGGMPGGMPPQSGPGGMPPQMPGGMPPQMPGGMPGDSKSSMGSMPSQQPKHTGDNSQNLPKGAVTDISDVKPVISDAKTESKFCYKSCAYLASTLDVVNYILLAIILILIIYLIYKRYKNAQ